MNSDEQNQNQQVNYDFITNQGGDLSVSEKKPKDRRVLIIIILIAITVVMFIALAFASKSTIKQQSETEQLPVKHLGYINDTNYEEAIKLYDNPNNFDSESFKVFWSQVMAEQYDLRKCEYVKTTEETDKTLTEMFCPFIEKDEGRILTYEISKSTGLIIRVTDSYGVEQNGS